GDGPPLGDVAGYVRLDGQPLPAALVTFQPDGGRPSTARTDEDGYYELSFSRSESGAVIGPHLVTISTYIAPDDEQDGVPERVPASFNEKSMVRREVLAGQNGFDFDLTTP